MNELTVCLIFVLAVISLISALFTEKKLLFVGEAVILLVVFYILNNKYKVAESWPLAMFLAGATLLALEIFIPSFGIIGISGIVLVGFALYHSYFMDGREIFIMVSSSFAIVLTLIVYVMFGFRVNIFDRGVLSEVNSKARGFNSRKDHKDLVGKVGKTISILRPAGKIEIDGSLYDATSQGGFIEKGKTVEVVSFTNGNIVVKEIQ